MSYNEKFTIDNTQVQPLLSNNTQVQPLLSNNTQVQPLLSISTKNINPIISLSSDKISFPFDYKLLKQTLDEMILITSNDDNRRKEIEQIQTLLQIKAKSNEYFEMLIQLIQKDLELVYRYVTPELFNKLNEIIMGLKVRRSELTNNDKRSIDLSEMERLSITKSKEISSTMSKYMKSISDSGKYIDKNGFVQNMIDNDMKYSIYNQKQHEKLGQINNSWNNDYVLLNTDKWMPSITHNMYKCKVEKQCPICPNLTTGYPVSVKEFDLARKILPPDIINEDYIREKLLTGLA
jgi:hypothetical protein